MKLSVIVPNYNHAQFLSQCIDSICQQEKQPDELLIIDDASTDHSVQLLSEYEETYSFIRLIKNQHNLGVHESVNIGISQSKGEWIAITAADDFIFPDFYQETYKVISKNPHIKLCFGDFCFFQTNEPNSFTRESIIPDQVRSRIYYPEELIEISKRFHFFIPSSSAIYHKNTLEKYLYNPDLKSLADFYLNMQIALRHPIAYIPKPFSGFRIEKNSYGNRIRKNIPERMRVYSTWITKVKKEDSQFREYFYKARLFAFGGYFMIFFLFIHPRHWNLLPFTFTTILKRKWFMRRKLG